MMSNFLHNYWTWIGTSFLTITGLIISYLSYRSKNKDKSSVNFHDITNSPIAQNVTNQNVTYNQTIQQVPYDHEFKRLDELKENFIFNLRSLLKPLEIQADNFMKVSESLFNNDVEVHEIGIVINLSGVKEKFKEFSEIDLNRVFPNASRHIGNIFLDIEQIDAIIKQSEIPSNQQFETINRLKSSIRDKLNDINSLFGYYIAQINQGLIKLNDDLFIRSLINIYESHKKVSKNFNKYFGKESLIEPLNNILINFANDQRAVDFRSAVDECLFAYKEIQKILTGIAENFSNYSSILLETANSLNSKINYLTNNI